jgi:hypothetical protein
MIPVLLGQTDHALDELRSAVARHDDAAERLVDDALESAQSVAAVALGDALRLTSAAIRSRR